MQSAFAELTKMSNLPSELAGWNTSKVEYLNHLTLSDNMLTSLSPLAGWNVSKVTSLKSICYSISGSALLASVILPHWNTSNLTDAYNLFSHCKQLTTVDISYWNTSNVTDAKYILDGCSKRVA